MDKTKKRNPHAKLFALLGRFGLNKEDMVHRFTAGQTTSLSTMYKQFPAEYHDLVNKLEQAAKKAGNSAELDKWRKRVIAAISGYARLMHLTPGNEVAYAKEMACRAAGKDGFNQIPLERLRGIYNAFVQKQKDLEFAGKLAARDLAKSVSLN